MLSNQDIRDVLKIGRTVLDCHTVDELRDAALFLIEDSFKCDSANFFLARNPGGKLDLNSVITRGITSENLARFRQYYYRLDPFLQWFPPENPVMTMEQVAPGPGLLKSEYYNDFLKPQAIRHQLTLSIQTRGRILGVVALFKPKVRGNFSGRDRAKADLIAPYLAGALERAYFTDQMDKQRLVFEIMAAQTPWPGVIVVDKNLAPIYYNQGALEFLPGRPLGPDYPLPEQISAACRHLMDPGLHRSRPDRETSMTLAAGGQKDPIMVTIRLIDHLPQSPYCLISLGPAGSTGTWSCKLKDKGVSKRELEVISLVARGLTNTQVADDLFISEHTVENHLKSIYKKLDVKNRTSLINQMIDLPL